MIFGCDGIAPKNQDQLAKVISPAAASTPTITPSKLPSANNPLAEQPANSNSNDDLYYTPITPAVPVIPPVVSKEEIAMRGEQLKIAQTNKRLAKIWMETGIGTQLNMRRAEYFFLSNKIQLLQAKKLLKLKQQQEEDKKATN
jgi:hypothetical protein